MQEQGSDCLAWRRLFPAATILGGYLIFAGYGQVGQQTFEIFMADEGKKHPLLFRFGRLPDRAAVRGIRLNPGESRSNHLWISTRSLSFPDHNRSTRRDGQVGGKYSWRFPGKAGRPFPNR